MPHEPKVGELPALRAWLAERESNSNRLANECEDEAAWREDAKYFRSAIESLDALAAEREARKDEARVERMENALHQISQWAQAYPLDVFPEPDFKKAYEVLKAADVSLGAVAASSMRHVITQVQAIVNAALQAEQPESP